MVYGTKSKRKRISSRRDLTPTSPARGFAFVASGGRNSIIASLMDSTSISIGDLSPLSKLSYSTLQTLGGKLAGCTNLCFAKYSRLSCGIFRLLRSSNGMTLTEHFLNGITSSRIYHLTISGRVSFTSTSGVVGER